MPSVSPDRPIYSVFHRGTGYGWWVRRNAPGGGVSVAGPFTTRDAAEAQANELAAAAAAHDDGHRLIVDAARHDAAAAGLERRSLERDRGLVEALEGQNALNATVARALEALSLQADRYDHELAELRAELAEVRGIAESSTAAVRAAGLLHSVKA